MAGQSQAPTNIYSYCALEHLEQDMRKFIDVSLKQLQPGVLRAASWERVLPESAVQFLSVSGAVESAGSYPEEYIALHVPLNDTVISQNGISVSQNSWVLLGAGQEDCSDVALSNGGSILIIFFPARLVDDFKDYFDQDIAYPKASAFRLSPSSEQNQRMIDLVWQLKQAQGDETVEQVFNEITQLFLGVLFADVQKQSKYGSRNRYHRVKLFNFVRLYLNSNYYKPLTMDDVSSRFNVTHRTLDRVFKSELGMTPMKYLMQTRLHAARKKLLAPGCAEIPIAKIAHDCGFMHVGRFSTYFKQQFGISPGQFRQLATGIKD